MRPDEPRSGRARRKLLRLGALALAVCLGVVTGCGTPIVFPPIHLGAMGWSVKRGQVIWFRQRGSEGIAGEILFGLRKDGEAYVQFSKGAFPMVVAQSRTNAWTASFPLGNQRYSGHGVAPERIIFLQLANAVAGKPLSKKWSWHKIEEGWRLENKSSGEALDVYWDQ